MDRFIILGDQIIPKKKKCKQKKKKERKKCKKANWLPEKALQIAEKRSKRQRRKGKTDPTECRVPKNSKETEESLLK